MGVEVVTSRTHAPTPGGSSMPLSGVLDVNTTTFSSPADTVENDAISYTLPANTLNTDGKALRITAWGKFAANGNQKNFRVYFGATEIQKQTVVGASLSPVMADILVVRDGVGSQKSISKTIASTTHSANQIDSLSEDETGDIVIKITAQNGTAAAADIVVEGMIVELLN